ncbi:hypothetical protein ACEI10_000005 [Vibrio harveyi]
MTHGLNFTSYI